MTTDTVKELFKAYRHNVCILKEKEKIYENYKKMYEEEVKAPVYSVDETIEGMVIGSSILSDMPRSRTNAFRSITENVALNYMDEIGPNQTTLNKILKAMADVQKEIKKLKDDISLTDNLLSALTDKEQFIIKQTLIHGYTNREASNYYNEHFQIPLYERNFRKVKMEAVKEMFEIIKKMEVQA
jgi:hypothetical protein